MIVVFDILILILCLSGMRICNKGFFPDYLGKTQCNAVKGICIIYVFASHILGYMVNDGYQLSGCGDFAFRVINRIIGQLCVTMFLFYSGFGVMQSIKTKGVDYVHAMPKHRILVTLLNFDVAVVAFAIVNLIMGIKMGWVQILFSLIGWDSVGNSNWYIFVILLCYAIACVGGHVGLRCVGPFVLLGCVLVWAALYFARPPHWYNTILAFPAGILYSRYLPMIEAVCKRYYVWTLCGLLMLFVALRGYLIFSVTDTVGIVHNVLNVSFAGIVVLATMKVKFSNSVLIWFGANLFPIYIYQRLPMRILANVAAPGFIGRHSLIYIGLCFGLTVALACLYRYWRIPAEMFAKFHIMSDLRNAGRGAMS